MITSYEFERPICEFLFQIPSRFSSNVFMSQRSVLLEAKTALPQSPRILPFVDFFLLIVFVDVSCLCTVGRTTLKLKRRVLGHVLLRSLIRSHRSACSAQLALLARPAALIRSLTPLTHSLRPLWERGFLPGNECIDSMQFQPAVLWLWRALASPAQRRGNDVMPS